MIFVNKEGRIRLFWKLLFIFFIFQFLSNIMISLLPILGQEVPKQITSFEEVYLLQVLSFLIMIIIVVFFALIIDKMPLKNMGLTWDRKGRQELWAGLLLPVIIMTIILLLYLVFGWLEITGTGLQVMPLFRLLFNLVKGLLLFTLVSFGEEILFRGYIINHYKHLLGGVLISSLIFALVHFLNPGITLISLLNIFLAGVFFAYTYLWTGSLWLPVGFHLSWNWVMGYLFGIPVSGINVESSLIYVALNQEAAAVLTGDQFGFEGSLLVTLMLIVVLLTVRAFLQKKGYHCPFTGKLTQDLKPEIIVEREEQENF